MRTLSTIFIVILILSGCSNSTKDFSLLKKSPSISNDLNRQLIDILQRDQINPMLASRIHFYSNLAMYEVLAGTDEQKHFSFNGYIHGYNFQPKNFSNTYNLLGGIYAFCRISKELVFAGYMVDNIYNHYKNSFKAMGITEKEIEETEKRIDPYLIKFIQWMHADYYKQTRTLPKQQVNFNYDGSWIPTAPGYKDAIEPNWCKLRTAVIDSCRQFSIDFKIKFDTARNSEFYKMADAVYQKSKQLTIQEKEKAKFWDDNPVVMTVAGHTSYNKKQISPPSHWICIAGYACDEKKIDLIKTQFIVTLLSINMYDAFINCFEQKYVTNLIRPESYINKFIDRDWIPFLQTPAFPEFTSGHSIISSAAANTLTKLMGEYVSFNDSTDIAVGMPIRHFNNFIEAADEAAISRFYGGIHFMPAIEQGKIQGKNLSEFIYSKFETAIEK